jgi:peptide/nickel transport system ATP-binding protein
VTDETPILEVRNLKTQFSTERGLVKAADDVSFTINEGETYGMVGESGAGKSVTGLSIMGLIDNPGRIAGGEIRYDGRDLTSISDEELRRIRGDEIAMIFQDPMSSLNPAFTVGEQVSDVILEHKDVSESGAREQTIELFQDVGIPDAASRVDDYPHQVSGGMRQRVMIAMALSCNPSLLVADEPTTALDVTIQAQILDLLGEIQEEYDMAIMLITHDMGVVAETCDRVGVMYAGRKVEEGPVKDIFNRPRHPYTVGLLKSIPQIDDRREKLDVIPGTMPDLIDTPSGCSFRDRCPHATDECAEIDPQLEPVGRDHTAACLRTDEIDFGEAMRLDDDGGDERNRDVGEPLLEAKNVRKYFEPESQDWFTKYFGDRKWVHAVDDVSLSIRKGETLGLVGESGCGKTTLARSLVQLYEPDDGTALYAGSDLTDMSKRQLRAERSNFQVIFQDPFSSLNPRATVKEIIGRPLEIHGLVDDREEKVDRVAELLGQVGLEESHLNRYPHEFSGGQKQRIGIARALAVEPDLIIADEPVSALDVSVQAQIINLLMDLQDDYGLTYLFVAHDLNVVQHISDRIAVMYLGEIVEVGSVEEIFEPPYHPYTEALLSSIPQPTPKTRDEDRIVLEGSVPSPIDPPSGCRFHTRCPYAMPECSERTPADVSVEDGHVLSCHLFDEEAIASNSEAQKAIEGQEEVIGSAKGPFTEQ